MKKKKYLAKEISTDSNTKLSISTTSTSIVSSTGEKKGLDGLAIILKDLDGVTIETCLTEKQLDDFIITLNRFKNILNERNHPSPIKCPF